MNIFGFYTVLLLDKAFKEVRLESGDVNGKFTDNCDHKSKYLIFIKLN